jgi:hypothetical protein
MKTRSRQVGVWHDCLLLVFAERQLVAFKPFVDENIPRRENSAPTPKVGVPWPLNKEYFVGAHAYMHLLRVVGAVPAISSSSRLSTNPNKLSSHPPLMQADEGFLSKKQVSSQEKTLRILQSLQTLPQNPHLPMHRNHLFSSPSRKNPMVYRFSPSRSHPFRKKNRWFGHHR